jgi:LuxR family transcriptional regulator, quorum-sensing system regulator BjaR1
MSNVHQDTFEAVECIQGASTVDAVMEATEQFASQFGADFVLLSRLTGAEHLQWAVLAARWPGEYLDLYRESEYFQFDPVACQARLSRMPLFVDTNDVYTNEDRRDPRLRDLSQAAVECGIDRGFLVPIHRPRSGLGSVNFAGADFELAPGGYAALHLVGLYAFDRVCRLVQCDVASQSESSLTTREREVLCWAMKGKTAWEIGLILHISTRTVETHIAHACTKLDAANRTQAVAVAIKKGLITP